MNLSIYQGETGSNPANASCRGEPSPVRAEIEHLVGGTSVAIESSRQREAGISIKPQWESQMRSEAKTTWVQGRT